MLNKGVRDEKKLKADKMLNTLLAYVFAPKIWNMEDTSLIDNQLTDFDLTTVILDQIEEKDLIKVLDKHEMDWEQKEKFADFLITYSVGNQFDYKAKALAIYEQIQVDSKTFSFGISAKIANLKKLM